jgi:pyruvate/2-oxoglutarate dehydrogenase complex dihydrolipoamide dehydrogenase (E3) component
MGGFDSQTKAKKNVVQAIKTAAEHLGNTPAICRKCYVHPAITDAYMNGSLLNFLKQYAEQEKKPSYEARHASKYGLRIPQAQADWEAVQQWMHDISERDEQGLEVDELLIAVGRRAAFTELNPEAAGVKTHKKGILVDETLRTSVPHIWAAGDVASPYQFTHVASEQGKLAVHNAFSSNPLPFDDRVIPWGIYTYPSLAHVGKTEQQLREDKVQYRSACVPFSENERAITEGKTEGLIKLLVDSGGIILGCHILGTRADDLLAPIILAMHASLPIHDLASTILPYPTVSEIVRVAAEKL